MSASWDFEEDLSANNSTDLTIEQCLLAGAAGVAISNEHYHKLPGTSGSNLTLLAESNRHLDHKHLFNLGSSPALTFGTLLHTMVLEPHDVENNYVVAKEFDGRTNAGKAEKNAFYDANKEKIVIDKNSFIKAERMARNVRAICGKTIDKGIKERSLFADIDGIVCKCRLDIDVEDVGDDYDLKSITLGIKEFSDATLEAHIKKLKYHWSAAFRNIIRRSLGKPVRDSYLIFCNTGMGHHVRVVRIAPLWIREAEAIVNDLLDSRRFYLASHIDLPIVDIDDRYRKDLESY